MKPLLLLLSLVLSCGIGAQSTLRGRVVDAGTRDPLVYATVEITGQGSGTITNEAGNFSLRIGSADSLTFQYLGYVARTLAVADLIPGATIGLTAAAFETETITVLSGDRYLYDLVARCRKLLTAQRDTRESRAYLHVMSSSGGRPVEFAESYYNASVSRGGVGEIEFKNGRSHLAPFRDGRYFLNYNVSKALSRYPLTEPSGLFPGNPLGVNRGALKRKYRLTLDHRTAETFFIRFAPRRVGSELFTGLIAIDRATGAPSLLELESAGAGQKAFTGLGGTRLDDIAYRLTFSFLRREEQSVPQYVRLDYRAQLVSLHDGEVLPIVSESMLHLFGFGEAFIPPLFDFPDNISDYQLFTLAPRDSAIWAELEAANGIELTPDQQKMRDEVRTSGELFRDTLPDGQTSFENNYLAWNRKLRIDIGYRQPSDALVPRLPPSLNYRPITLRKDQFYLDVRLYLDLNPTSDGLLYRTNTLLDPYRSFNLHSDDPGLRVYANLYFDLGEVYRRKLVRAIGESDQSVASARALFDVYTAELIGRQRALQREVFPGTNLARLTEWNDYIRGELGIDNVALLMGQ